MIVNENSMKAQTVTPNIGLNRNQSSGSLVHQELIDRIWRGRDPYADVAIAPLPSDVQGWGSSHPFLTDVFDICKPRVVVEVGVWKGGSTITMARRMRDLGLDSVVLAVDTWLGAWDHWTKDEYFADLFDKNGRQTLYRSFLSNIVHEGLQKYVIPMPLDSLNAAYVVKMMNIESSIIHLDAAHDYEAVSKDLVHWWPTLQVGGVLIADDYDPQGVVWPPVKEAVDDFLKRTPHSDFSVTPYKCRFRKTL